MKHTCKIISAQFSEFGKSEKLIAAMIMGAAFACYYSCQFLRFANAASVPVNPVECYIINGSGRNHFTCTVLFSILLMTFDAPFFSERSVYEIARVGKKQWLASKTVSVFLEILAYNLLIFLITAALSLFCAENYVFGSWSPAMSRLAEAGIISLGGLHIYFPYSDFIDSLSPTAAVSVTYLLNSAYCLVLSLVMMNCNILLGRATGWIVGAVIHILGYVVSNNGHGVLFRFAFSLLDCALPAHQFSKATPSKAIASGIIFVIIIVGLLLPAKWLWKRLVQ